MASTTSRRRPGPVRTRNSEPTPESATANGAAIVAANKMVISSNAKIKESEEELATMRAQGQTKTSQYKETLH